MAEEGIWFVLCCFSVLLAKLFANCLSWSAPHILINWKDVCCSPPKPNYYYKEEPEASSQWRRLKRKWKGFQPPIRWSENVKKSVITKVFAITSKAKINVFNIYFLHIAVPFGVDPFSDGVDIWLFEPNLTIFRASNSDFLRSNTYPTLSVSDFFWI